MYGGPSISFLRYELLKNDVTIFDPFWPENAFSSFSYTRGLLVCANKKFNCFDIQGVVEASSFRLNHHMTLESKENYPRHTKTVQNSLGFMSEVKPLHKPHGDLVLCALHSVGLGLRACFDNASSEKRVDVTSNFKIVQIIC